MTSLLPTLDRFTRTFWRVHGRPVDLAGDERWLDAPMHDTQAVGDRWLQAAAVTHGGTVGEHVHGRGLLDDMARLDGPGFRADDLRPEIRDFYEHTSSWRMEVWTQWSPVFRPAGDLLSRLFGRRVQQLALPTRPLAVAHGMDSRVVALLGPSGEHRAAAWIRTLRSTGEYVYSGCYSSRLLPGSRQPSVHVAFPLQAGNVQVFLRPSVSCDGALTLTSPAGRFGEDGAYVVVDDRGAFHAARAPVHETFHLYVDDEGVLRTDHVLRLWAAPVVRLHYKLTPAEPPGCPTRVQSRGRTRRATGEGSRMSDEQRPDPPQPEPAGDYGYDMAHDFESSQTTAPAGSSGAQQAVYVSTQTSDTDEDYSYDMAHDVPPQRPR